MYRQLFALVLFQTKSLLKLKATSLMVVLALASMVLSLLLSDVNIAQKYKLFEDILLLSQSFLLHVAALFYAFEFLNREKLSALFVLPLSTGMSRMLYLVGSVLTLFTVIGTLFGAFFISDIIALILVGDFYVPLLLQLLLYYCSAMLLAVFVVLFSQYVSLMNSLIYAVVLFMVGSALDELWMYAHEYPDVSLAFKYVSEFLYYTIPNFSLYDHSDMIVSRASLDYIQVMVVPLLYTYAMVTIAISISYMKFKNRVLKIGE